MTGERPAYLPGDRQPAAEIARAARVDQAGEYGAVRIYDGQRAVTPPGRAHVAMRRMGEQEKRHLAAFDALLNERRVRPTLLQPLWHAAGFALGAATALMGARAAMACTVAVEEVIEEHYADQAARLAASDPLLAERLREYRADELAHRQTALDHGAADAPFYDLVSAAVKTGSRLAIWLSTRV